MSFTGHAAEGGRQKAFESWREPDGCLCGNVPVCGGVAVPCMGIRCGDTGIASVSPTPTPRWNAKNSGAVGSVWGLWDGGRMRADILKDIVALMETWPVAAQEELAGIARAMDDALKGGMYHATPEELAGIDRGLASARAGRFATDAEVAALFEKYRPA